MCLYFYNLPVEIFTRDDSRHSPPADHQQAIVVTEKQRVFRLNETAAELGIQQGNSMDTAYTLSDKVVSFERDEDKETSSLSHLAQWAYQFTPNIVMNTPDCLLLDITGCLKLFKGLPALTTQIKNGLWQLGYQPVITINPTPLAARLLACALAKTEVDDKRYDGMGLSRAVANAADYKHTDNRSAEVARSIHAIPVEFLQVDKKIIISLQQMGIYCVKQLLDLPNSGIIRRFGVSFVDYLQRLIGARADPQKFVSPTPEFSHGITFLSDVTNLNSLAFPINRLLGELAEFLAARQLYVDHFTWHLSHRNHGENSFGIYLANPENNPKIFLTLTQLKLD